MPSDENDHSPRATDIPAALYGAVTERVGFAAFLTLVMASFCLLRILFPDAPSNADVGEQRWMSADWRLAYGSGANPPLFTWLVKLVDKVAGDVAASAEIVRFGAFWLFCHLSAVTVRDMTGDARLAALSGLAPFAVYAVGWEALFRHSNTMLLIAAIPMTLAALLRLDRRDDWGGYLIFALVTAFGFYGKYNYALVWAGFLGAALMDGRLRARLLDRRMVAALLLAALLLSPLMYWIVQHLDGILGHGRLRLDQQPTFAALPGPVSALVDLAGHLGGLLAPLVLFLVVLCPRAFWRLPKDGDAEVARWRGLLGRYLVIVAVMLVAAAFALGMSRFQLRYVYVLLPLLPLLFLRLAAAGISGRPRQWLALALVAVILLVFAGAVFRGASYAKRHASAASAIALAPR